MLPNSMPSFRNCAQPAAALSDQLYSHELGPSLPRGVVDPEHVPRRELEAEDRAAALLQILKASRRPLRRIRPRRFHRSARGILQPVDALLEPKWKKDSS